MSKYLDDSKIIPNHWYRDEKGQELLYLGKADIQFFSFDSKGLHIYLKKKVMEKYFKADLNSIPVETLLDAVEEDNHYFSSKKPRKFIEEIGVHPGRPLAGRVGIFNFDKKGKKYEEKGRSRD